MACFYGPRLVSNVHRKESYNLVTIYVNGVPLSVYKGLPLAVALYRNGIYGFSRSYKYGRLRGFYSLDWWGAERVGIEDGFEENPYVLQTREGLKVSCEMNVTMLNKLIWVFRNLFKVGFYNNWFFRSRFGWNLLLNTIKKTLPYNTPPLKVVDIPPPPKNISIETDVLVVGGGLAGLSAAVAASKSGAKTVLVEATYSVGGRLRYIDELNLEGLGSSGELIKNLVNEAVNNGVKILGETVFQGILDDAYVGYSLTNNTTILFKPKVVVVATGSREIPAIFEENDLPRIMYLSAATRLLKIYNTLPGRKGVIIGLNNDSIHIAEEFMRRGIKVTIVDKRRDGELRDLVEEAAEKNIEVITGVTRIAAKGANGVSSLEISVDGGARRRLNTFFVAMSPYRVPDMEVSGQFKIASAFDVRIGGFVPLHAWNGETNMDNILIAGSAGGILPMEVEYHLSRAVGYLAAHKAGGKLDDEYDNALNMGRKTLESNYPETLSALEDMDKAFKEGNAYSYYSWRKPITWYEGDPSKQFVCYSMDVTVADLIHMVEDMDMYRMELVKRFSGLGTGSCQGRDCIFNAAVIISSLSGKTPLEVGRFRTRYPVIPHKLYSLAGVEI